MYENETAYYWYNTRRFAALQSANKGGLSGVGCRTAKQVMDSGAGSTLLSPSHGYNFFVVLFKT